MLEDDNSIVEDSLLEEDTSATLDGFREDAKHLLANKQYLRNYIVKLRSTVREGSARLNNTEGVSERIEDLEEQILSAVIKLKSKNEMLKFAQISSRINHHRGWDPANASKTSTTENDNLVRQFERMYIKQIQYMELKREVSELEIIMRDRQEKCLEATLQTRSLHAKLEKLKSEKRRDVVPTNQAINKRKEHLSKGIRVYTLMRHLFIELILCSQVDWQLNPELSELIVKLNEKLEFE